jgi:hypothetical protein
MKKYLIAAPLVLAFAIIGGLWTPDQASAATPCVATKVVYVTDLTSSIDRVADQANSDAAYTDIGNWHISPNSGNGVWSFENDGLHIDLAGAGPVDGKVSWPAGASQTCEPVMRYTATSGVTASINAYGGVPGGSFGIKKDPNTPASANYWATSSAGTWQHDFTGVGKDAGCAVAANI